MQIIIIYDIYWFIYNKSYKYIYLWFYSKRVVYRLRLNKSSRIQISRFRTKCTENHVAMQKKQNGKTPVETIEKIPKNMHEALEGRYTLQIYTRILNDLQE